MTSRHIRTFAEVELSVRNIQLRLTVLGVAPAHQAQHPTLRDDDNNKSPQVTTKIKVVFCELDLSNIAKT